jgi:hypothetical protein
LIVADACFLFIFLRFFVFLLDNLLTLSKQQQTAANKQEMKNDDDECFSGSQLPPSFIQF